MRLAQLLKKKNFLVQEHNRISGLIHLHNSRQKDVKLPDYVNVQALFAKKVELLNDLISVKTAINLGNACLAYTPTVDNWDKTIVFRIILMSELKTLKAWFEGLNTKAGPQAIKMNYNRVSGEQTEVMAEFVADISADDVYKNVEKINKQVQDLQDSVDYTNATLEMEVPKIEVIKI